MTEDEAKTKWCFHFIASHNDPRAEFSEWERQEGKAPGPFRHHCIASACMAWLWKQEPLPAVVDDAVDGDGFCGLAGRPS
jgi:hypothetical protein